MAPRRRFFPSTTAQKVPGRTVELEMQLRPVATAPAPTGAPTPGGGTGPVDVTWLPHQSLWEGVDVLSDNLGGGQWNINNGWGIPRSVWVGEPTEVDEGGNARPVLSAGFRCIEIEVVTSYWIEAGRDLEYFGVIQGATLADARWDFEWNKPHLENPAYSKRLHRAEVFGNVVRVLLTSTKGGLKSRETLTARAYSGGAQVGELKLVAIVEVE